MKLPSHDHTPEGGGSYLKSSGDYVKTDFWSGYLGGFSASFTKTSPAGGNQPHENMPPYIAAFWWKRLE